jgi:hypothetical protein
VIPEARAARVIALVETLAAQPRVASLMDALTAQEPPQEPR